MNSNFLSRFRSGMKELQSQQILSLITREKDRGSITTVDEFRARLQELTTSLASKDITPTIELFKAIAGDRIDSDSFNFMISRIEDDLKTGFKEANDIDEVLDSHETIVNDVVLKNLELAINDLEAQIASLKFIQGTSGFDQALFNTFRVTQNARSAFQQNVIFVDPKTLLLSEPGNEAVIDFIGEKLVLGQEEEKEIRIVGIEQIFDDEAHASEIPVEFDNSSLFNIIDSKVGTFWSQSTLLSRPNLNTGVITKLILDLGVVKTINYLQLEPITTGPISIIDISYLNENNQLINILNIPRIINTTNKLFFSSISAKKIYISIQNREFIVSEFELKPDSASLTIERTGSVNIVGSIREELLENISSPRIRSVLGIEEAQEIDNRKYYEYLLGFDNIKVGYSSFKEHSFFVSPTERINQLGQVALKVFTRRPLEDSYTTDVQPVSFDDFFQGNAEFYLIKRDYSSTGTTLDSYLVPIAPRNSSVVRHERLILNNKTDSGLTTNNIGYLQLYTDELITEMKVYRNGFELTPTDLSTINPYESDGWLINTDLSQTEPEQGKPMRRAIQIQQPNPIDIYTVSYTPSLGDSVSKPVDVLSSPGLIVDLVGRLEAWLGPDRSIYFSQDKKGIPIAYSDINLVIVLRRNTSDITLSPVVEEYFLATASVDSQKFGVA